MSLLIKGDGFQAFRKDCKINSALSVEETLFP
jgi:hypothetical protein